MCTCADVLNFKYRDLKMFLLKLGSELQNLMKKSQSVLKMQRCKLHFHKVEEGRTPPPSPYRCHRRVNE